MSEEIVRGHDGQSYRVIKYIEPNSKLRSGDLVARFKDPNDGGHTEIGEVVSFDGFGFHFKLFVRIDGREIEFNRDDGAFAVVEKYK